MPPLKALFQNNYLGAMPGRTWVYAPDQQSLIHRWETLLKEKDSVAKEILFHPHPNGDKAADKISKSGLAGHEHRPQAARDDSGSLIAPTKYSFRSFDRQWIIPDNRLLNRPNPNLWEAFSPSQFYLIALDRTSPANGAAATFACNIPDHDFFKGSAGGRVYPIWTDASARKSNLIPELLAQISTTIGGAISPEQMMAYLAAVLSSPYFPEKFRDDLLQPGLRVPLTADATLFAEAASLGREVIWLHCYGERFVDDAAGRPFGPPRLPKEIAPTIPKGGAIPPAPEPLPDDMHYDAAKQRLHIGKGYIDNVAPEIWAYEISGKNVLKQWFSYRKRDRSRPVIGEKRPPSPLSLIQPDGWLAEYTTDLLDLLNVLGRVIALHDRQADLLTRICDGPLIALEDLQEAGIVARPENAGADDDV